VSGGQLTDGNLSAADFAFWISDTHRTVLQSLLAFGNVGRNFFSGPGYNYTNLQMYKDFPILKNNNAFIQLKFPAATRPGVALWVAQHSFATYTRRMICGCFAHVWNNDHALKAIDCYGWFNGRDGQKMAI
jgi:hypothetical protein